MVGGVAEINGSQQLPRPAVLVPCACVSAAQAETLRYRCSLCAVTLHRGASRLQKMTETSVKASIFLPLSLCGYLLLLRFTLRKPVGWLGRGGGSSVQQFVSPLHSCANPPLESLFLPPPYKVTDTHFAAVFEISTRWPRGQLDPKSTFIERRPPHPPAVVTFFRSCCHIRMLTLCLKASRDLLGCKKKKATWLMTRSVISTG